MIKGKGVSVGVGFGNTVILKNEERKIEKTTVEDSKAEMDRLKKAIEEVTKETEEIVNKSSGTDKEIMSAYLMILQDPALTQAVIIMLRPIFMIFMITSRTRKNLRLIIPI